MNRCQQSFVLLAAGVCLLLCACSQDKNTAGLSHYMLPPDFALLLHVNGEPGADNPLRQTAQYLIEPNRTFHAAVGDTIAADFYPQKLKVISREEYYDLAGHVLANQLMAEPTSPRSQALDGGVVYTVEIQAHGLTHRYTTTPGESPPTVQTLQRLVALLAQSDLTRSGKAASASDRRPQN